MPNIPLELSTVNLGPYNILGPLKMLVIACRLNYVRMEL